MINGPGKYTVKTAAFRITIIAVLRSRVAADAGQIVKTEP
jgi:hypothetical protein